MPFMITNPAQQSTNRTTTRSELSGNWRTKIDAPPREGNDAASPTPTRPTGRDYLQQRNDKLNRDNVKRSAITAPRPSPRESVRGEDDPRTIQAIAEGRRLYVGNMSYMAKSKDVRALFSEGSYSVEHVNMSIDPFTGRNPSYSFVELASKQEADQAMVELNGRIMLRRPVKLGLGVARSQGKRPHGEKDREPHNAHNRPSPIFDRWTRTDVSEHWKGYCEQGRRCFVGGLPRMLDHETVNTDVRVLFKGYNIEAVSKVVIPRTPIFGEAEAWNHRYLFVDFSTSEEADRAVKATNGRQAWGGKIRVRLAKAPASRKPDERDAWHREASSLAREHAFELDH